ncbi:hypothetical protein L3V31_15695 [Vibrio sp. J1-1]|uniref:hypothetical protein n=1 Tax=Vibrio sp. J1-1 TaxID=2912251 RepID=UPI001F337F43|nr:hypothetical protein [Vibrio sp. J1-1]MCF7483156.1 hypothetical protein [Vibrio sp. J1-1]
MPKRNRSTLKNFFQPGNMPSAEHFADLIDSCVNQVEDGFEKPPATGLQLTALDQEHLLSFYQQSDRNTALWHVGLAAKTTNLHFKANPLTNATDSDEGDAPETNLTLTPSGNVGIKTETPEHELDVKGTVSSQGRRGAVTVDALIPADGKWHDITETLEGCQMLEVVAGIGIRHTGRYAMLHAIAINTCAPNHWWWQWRRKNPIKAQHAFFRSPADKLKLRWLHETEKGTKRPYRLQIRTNTSYGDNRYIRYHITKLWDDDYMTNCEIIQEDKQA